MKSNIFFLCMSIFIAIFFLSCRKDNIAVNNSIYGKWKVVKSYSQSAPSIIHLANDGSYCEIKEESMHIHTAYEKDEEFSDFTFSIRTVANKIYTDTDYTGVGYFQIQYVSDNKLVIAEYVQLTDGSIEYSDTVELIKQK